MSIAGGPANALLSGHSVGCDTIQMFIRNPNRWRSMGLTPEQIADFRQARKATGIEPVIAHGSYLINLGTPDEALWQRSLDALIIELRRCHQLGILDYVLHPGSHVGSGEEAGLLRVAAGLSAAFEATADAPVTVLLETTAGQGSNLGYRFEHLAWLMHHAKPKSRLGACFDTAHALAAGYEFRQPESYKAMWERFGGIVGTRNLSAIHLNDSKHDIGSRADRHEHIGQGFVGLEAFRLLVNDASLHHIPMLLETPKGADMSMDIENLALLRSLIADAD